MSLLLLLLLRALALFWIPPQADEIVQGYMTDDIVHLRNFPLYYYGQSFMGPVESYLLAPLVRIFGSDYGVVRLGNELFYLAFVILFLKIVSRLFDRETARPLFFLLSVAPFPVLFFTTVFGYGEILPLALLSLLFLLKTLSDPKASFQYAAVLGLISGLAFWCNPIFVIWLVPIGISLVGFTASGERAKALVGFTAGSFVGLLPAWCYAFQTGRPMFINTAGPGYSPLEHLPHMAYLFFARMKYFLTASFFESPSWLRHVIPFLAWIPAGLFALSWVSLFFHFFQEKDVRKKSVYLFVLLPPGILFLLYTSRDLTTDEGIRYFLPLIVSYAFSVAWWVRRLPSWGRRAVLTVLGGILLLSSLGSLDAQNRQRMRYLQIVRFLEQNGLHYGVGDFNAAYAVNALSRGQILASPPHYGMRYSPLWNAVRDHRPQFFLFETVDHRYRNRLASDPQVTHAVVGGRDIYYGTSGIFQEILETNESL